MFVPYHKIERLEPCCRKCSNVNCARERKSNKKNLKPYLSRARIKVYEEKIIKEQLNEYYN